MNDRDFDNIFRKKMEQIDVPSTDHNLWQQIDNQLVVPKTKTRFGWYWSLAALLLLSVGLNIFLWKKSDRIGITAVTQNNEVPKTIIQHDTIIKKIYIVEKYFPNGNQTTEKINLDKNNNIQISENQNVKSNYGYKDKTLNENINSKIGVENVPNSSSDLSLNLTADNQKDNNIFENKNELKATVTDNINTTQNPQNDTIAKQHLVENKASTPSELGLPINTQTIENQTLKTETMAPPHQIKPVKNRRLSHWLFDIHSNSGLVVNDDLKGYFNGGGLSVKAHLNSKWRIGMSIDAFAIEFQDFDKWSRRHGNIKPNPGPPEKFENWRIHQPNMLLMLGIERVIYWKKLEFSAGLQSGIIIRSPYEVRYEVLEPITQEPRYYKKGFDNTEVTFGSIATHFGVSRSIYKKFNISLFADYQYVGNNSNSDWQHRTGAGLGLQYRIN